MGGTGSGNHSHWWPGRKKTAVEHCPALDVNRWKREGILRAGAFRAGSWKWTYSGGRECSNGARRSPLDYDVDLAWEANAVSR